MSSQLMPEAIQAANVYLKDGELYGIAEVQLPSMEAITTDLKGAGIAGGKKVAIKGLYESMVLALNNWRTVSDGFVAIMAPKVHEVDIYASLQEFNVVTGELEDISFHVFVKGRPVKTDPGKLIMGDPADAAVEIEVDYMKIERNDKEIVEIDKYNWICRIDGVDYLETIRKNSGKG